MGKNLTTLIKMMNQQTKRVALYARVSKAVEQNPENQLIELRRWAKNNDYIVVGEFVDELSSRDLRPQKEAVLKLLRMGDIDAVAFSALDRWGRNVTELVMELEEFSRTGKSLISLREGLDLSTAAGRLMANVLACMANFERDRIKERVLMGIARARAQGKHIGRPIVQFNELRAKQLLFEGKTYGEVAIELGVPKATVFRRFKNPPKQDQDLFINKALVSKSSGYGPPVYTETSYTWERCPKCDALRLRWRSAFYNYVCYKCRSVFDRNKNVIGRQE